MVAGREPQKQSLRKSYFDDSDDPLSEGNPAHPNYSPRFGKDSKGMSHLPAKEFHEDTVDLKDILKPQL